VGYGVAKLRETSGSMRDVKLDHSMSNNPKKDNSKPYPFRIL